ncbi:hypothetical protein POTOM_031834 [Populus tomentosa]|uniref:Pentatricopeptide repeat-containing protein n=1 Tax=Populus tomentosa TaxID=118781 RepID=A0A8X7Z4V7_POPTO|nr:hypothetical protein POTOM_031834 [Populus tomentosa]
MERSWRLIEIMAELGISPDRMTLNYLLTAYCFKGDLTAASGVVKRIEEEGLGVDSRAYDVPVLDAFKFVMICGGKEEGLDSENFRIWGSKLIEFERFKEAKLVLEEM